ncbi:MAG: ECF transporter S component [Patescibacteria group bacterium]|jgi:hypothetical protein
MQKINSLSLPIVRIEKIELIAFTSLFVALAVGLPQFTHQFNLAGPIFLPMHIFVLIAGLIFGWRTGLIVGLFTPLVSFATSGMPMLAVLPQITAELTFYGLLAGIFREKLNLNIYLSLIFSMIIGRLGLIAALTLFSSGQLNPFISVWLATKIAWPGILIQLSLVPIMAIWIKKFVEKGNQ